MNVYDLQQYHPLKNVRIEIQCPNPAQLFVETSLRSLKGKTDQAPNKTACHENVQEMRGVEPSIFTSAPDGRNWSASSHDLYTREERVTVTHRRDGTVRPNSLDAGMKRKISTL
jgi:hypothetical protein